MTSPIPHLLGGLAHALKETVTWPIQKLRHEVYRAPGLVLILLAVLIFCAIRTIRGDRLAAMALIPLSLGWLLFNGPFEGPTLVVLSWSHGITGSDLFSLIGLGLAAWRLIPAAYEHLT